jgi:beta-lactamase regulating signal transducer with metallopeptidase domain
MMFWIARSLVLTMLIAVAAYCIETALRGHSARTRWVWAIAMLLTTLLPLATIVPREVWPARLHSPPILSALHPSVAETPPVAASLPVDDLKFVRTEIPAAGASSSRSYLLWLWLAGSAFCVLRYMHGWMRLQRARRRWQPTRLADDVILITDGLGPAVIGLFRTQLVVPQWVLTAPAERQRMILQHEREHVRARDHLLLGLAPLFAILFPWNPGVWWQLRRFRLAVECDCDARVLRSGTARAEYGAMLLDVATTKTALNFGLAGLIEPRSLLQRRIEAMKAGQIRKSLTRVVMLQGTALVALATAVMLTVPPSAPLQAQSRTQANQAPRAGDMLYVVDGKVIGTRAALDATALGVTVGKITVLSPAAAQARYGAQGANGAVVITTRPAIKTDDARAKVQPFKPPVVKKSAKVDIVRVDTAQSVTVVHPDSLPIVEVPATQTIPTIRTSEEPMIIVDGVIQERGSNNPILMIDGVLVQTGVSGLRQIDPNTIESVEIIKGEAAVRLYGERGRNGVITIKTKRD